jgi:flagellar hook assembly protein FlgD
LPISFALYRPFPNPFNPTTTIRFDIGVEIIQHGSRAESRGATSLQIYDITGRLVETLMDEKLEPGTHEIKWQAKNHASGIYFIRMVAGEFVKTQKMILLK